MNTESYRCVYTGGCGEITEKKSRFIATVHPVSCEEDALAFIEQTKKKYWDARHNCSAYVIGANNELSRCSDDGEPAKTAGRPMLDVLLSEGIHDAAVVVTRYFGGVLLGTGGLVRAYQAAVKAGLAASAVIEKSFGRHLTITTSYTDFGKLQYIAASEKIPLLSTEYTDTVTVTLFVTGKEEALLTQKLTEATNARAAIVAGEESFFAVLDGKLLLFPH
ncbi:MAG: YigZ family protein [Lachnospiraceae bacterium]|nr:YigZ family protein [Lachnospiraceae bacterium]